MNDLKVIVMDTTTVSLMGICAIAVLILHCLGLEDHGAAVALDFLVRTYFIAGTLCLFYSNKDQSR